MKVDVEGTRPCAISPRYSSDFTPRKTIAMNDASHINLRAAGSGRDRANQIAADIIRKIAVFANPRYRFSTSLPCGQNCAETRSSAYDENSAPNSITSDARNSQIPSVTFETRV